VRDKTIAVKKGVPKNIVVKTKPFWYLSPIFCLLAGILICCPDEAIAQTISITISHLDAACFGGNTGTATATATGGTLPYSYSWNTNPYKLQQLLSDYQPEPIR
jgi:hypothetical protein